MARLVAINEGAWISIEADASGNVCFRLKNPIVEITLDLDVHDPDELQSLRDSLIVLSRQVHPWEGTIDLDTIDGCLSMSFTCGVHGHVTVETLVHSHGSRAEVRLVTELGQLSGFGRDASALIPG